MKNIRFYIIAVRSCLSRCLSATLPIDPDAVTTPICIRHCQDSNLQHVLSQIRADSTRSQWLTAIPDDSRKIFF